MAKEQFNSFNGLKALTQVDYWKPIINGYVPFPRLISIDLSGKCNLSCSFCNANKVKGNHSMSRETMNEITQIIFNERTMNLNKERFAVCIGGGGESTLNKDLAYFVKSLNKLSVDVGLVTNGVDISNLGDISKYKWIGVSVDAASRETYKKIKGADKFNKVLSNIKKLTADKKTEVTYKFLIHPDNKYEIEQAILKAKELNCNQIHIRPAHYTWFDKKDKSYFSPVDAIMAKESIDRMIKREENKDFKIRATLGKVDANFNIKNDFKECNAVLTTCGISYDGTVFLCCDLRGKKSNNLCDIKDFNKYWGSAKHYNMAKAINPKKCPRCTLGTVNEIFENVIINDNMYCNFY